MSFLVNHILSPILQTADIVLVAIAAMIVAVRPLHLLQLESYQLDGYKRACKRQNGLWREGLIVFLITVGVYILISIAMTKVTNAILNALWGTSSIDPLNSFMMMINDPTMTLLNIIGVFSTWRGGLIAFLAGIGLLLVRRKRPKPKKPLVYTQRVKRLMAMLLLINLLVITALRFIPIFGSLVLLLPIAFQVLLVRLAALCIQPIENHINLGFFNDAKRRLEARGDLIKIGITGSYGKTSTKFILAAILREEYNVLATPSSFNTPMGLTRVIREQLEPSHQVFIAEMGARHVGDIDELCQLVHPTIGAITSIGPQHLETFHTIDNVLNTKYELIASLPPDGAAFFGDDDALCRSLYTDETPVRRTLAGIGPGEGVRIDDIHTGPEGSHFTLTLSDGTSMPMHTQLLGRHNIQNIALCCAIAHHLGLTPEQIADGVAKAPPVEHRLQLIRGAGGNVVIDDAFNSNPAGAKAALDVLSQFPGRRIVVTPGMVELGEMEDGLNEAFGRQMAKVCHVAILIGKKRTLPIREGLLEGGFDEKNLITLSSLDEAATWLAANARPGDVTLFENDLPDNYSE